MFEATGREDLARRWPDGVRWLAVDPGTPYAVTLEAGPVRRRAWLKAYARTGGPQGGRLLTHRAGRVSTTVAYDYGRAVNLAGRGLSARFCVPHEAEQAIVYTGALSKSAYRAWEEFSAGYALGRVLRFDGEDYGDYHQDNVTAHRLLAESGGSPWRNPPWR
ncbi:DUF1266 domain-containing protein [Streptomyces sp. NPDC014623]|uniref:DUF1266 domain-containing protein n=1 Tax=Streptomyces sp. NPDC014623 TaxID=3364875 RepID=UPI0036FBCE31